MEAGLYPFSVQITGVMIKEKKKLFMTSVLWSDQNEIVVYRSFGEFKKVHRELKKAFPPTNKLKKSDRILPKFRDKKMKQGSPKKSPNKSLTYIKFLQEYCDKLLNCDPQISQSADVVKFFSPKDQDLKSDFSKNSIIIIPSEDEIRGDGGHGNAGNVTQPFVTETYVCVAPYETKDTKNKPFKVAVDEKLDVLIKDKGGWWLVEKEDKQMAWFPAPYLAKLDDDDDEDEMDGPPERGMFYTAVKGYRATKSDEITVNIGAVVEVLQHSENGWWLIRRNGKVGYIPTMYLQPYSNPHIRLSPHHHHHALSPAHSPLSSGSSSPFLAPPSDLQQHAQLSRSQGDLLQSPPVRSSSPIQLPLGNNMRSQSLEILSEKQPSLSPCPPHPPLPPPPPPRAAANAQQVPLPTIMVEMNEEEEEERGAQGTMVRASSECSFMSDSTDFSLSDEFSSSSASSSLNVSLTPDDDRLLFSHTPPPPSSNRLSPTGGLGGRLIPSVSDPNLYQGPRSPKVPPRPRAKDILSRCGTITRRNAAQGGLSPTEAEIASR